MTNGEEDVITKINELEQALDRLPVLDPNDAIKHKQLIYELRNLIAIRYAKGSYPTGYFNTTIS